MRAQGNNHLFYNKKLKNFARSHRGHGTKAEACLWKHALRAKTMKGFSFKRQRPVLNYIADFMCTELKLIIEVDGVTHLWEGAKEKDKQRQINLEKAGFKLIRFTDKEVLTDIGGVMDEIAKTIEELSLPL